MEALSKVLTSADFHPIDCHTFLYSSSRGCVRLGDMRAAALCDASAKSFEASRDTSETLPRDASSRLPRHFRGRLSRATLSQWHAEPF